MDDNHWWSERLEAWTHEGFNTDSFRNSLRAEPELASQLLIEFDSMVARNRNLRRRIIDSSMQREKKGRWLSDLDDVAITDSLLEKWERDAALNRPWEPYVHNAESRWSEHGLRSELTAIVKRLNALDPSSFSACQPLMILFDDAGSENLISSMLDDIETDEVRRRQVVDEMIELLGQGGVDASDARRMKIGDALDHLTSLQARAEEVRNNRLRIEKEIRPFDDALANRLLSKKGDDVTAEVDAIVDNLSERLKTINQMVSGWENRGIIFKDGGKVTSQELLDWEAGLPEIEKTVGIHLQALERWKDFEMLWPDKCKNSTCAGRLELTTEFVDLVDSLDQEWRELELEGMQIISSWEDKGFAMDVWLSRLSEEPRSAVAWLKREEDKYNSAFGIIDALLALDSSVEDEEEILRRVAILREFDLDVGLIEEMNEFVDSRVRRGARHRSMLESEWMELLRKGLAEDRPTSLLSLFEFEELISDVRLKRHNSGIPVDRVGERIQEEILNWHESGFSVDSLNQMLEENPIGLALRITSIREAVAKHEQIRRRLSNLDWTRDPEGSVSVNHDLAHPERLDSLVANIPQLMMELAQKSVVDEHFAFIPWRPQRRSRPVLIPVPKNTVEDAMEAILEEMEGESEDEVEVVEKIVENTVDAKTISKTPKGGSENQKKKKKDSTLSRKKEPSENKDTVLAIPPTKKIEKRANLNTSALERLLRSLGLEDTAGLLNDNQDINAVRRALSPHVGVEPRDMRLDRLLRLSLRLMPNKDENDEKRSVLLENLADLADILSHWTRIRLEARNNGSKGHLIDDASKLGIALKRIPGPGTPIPLDIDEYELPKPDDIEGLSNEVNVLKRRVALAKSGGIN
jgi:hypothetical protein